MSGHEGIAAGEVLAGRYELRRLLGRGGMAEVWQAEDGRLGRAVAVKVLPSGSLTEDAVVRQAAEARMGALVTHPGLVAVYDVHPGPARPFLVMELVEGGTLATALADGPVPPGVVADIAHQLAEALAVVHDAGIVHRDIKPSNVMLVAGSASSAGAPRVKLTDFGIARLADGAGLTSTGVVVGTARYLSPEQAAGEAVGPATDVYALGLVLLECLTGDHPFPGTQSETLAARLTRQPSIPSAHGPGWSRLLTAMTDRDPAARPSATGVATALGGLDSTRRLPVADGSAAGVTTGNRGARRTVAAWVKGRRPLVAAAIVTAAVVLAAIAGVAWVVATDAPSGRTDPPQSTVAPPSGEDDGGRQASPSSVPSTAGSAGQDPGGQDSGGPGRTAKQKDAKEGDKKDAGTKGKKGKKDAGKKDAGKKDKKGDKKHR